MLEMFKAQINSLPTTIVVGISSSDNHITLHDASVLPPAPNVATLGTGDDAETIMYMSVIDNTLYGVVRGFQGTAKSWVQGTTISRNFTAYDHDTFINNISEIISLIENLNGIKRQAVLDGNFQIAQLNPITGSNKSVGLTNLVINGNFSNSTSSWINSNATVNVTGGVLQITATTSGGQAYQTINNIMPGHKYYGCSYAKSTAATSCYTNFISQTSVGVTIADHAYLLNNTALTFQSVFFTGEPNIGKILVSLPDWNVSGWGLRQYDNIMLIDITASFGAGNEPTKAELDALVQANGMYWDGVKTLTSDVAVRNPINGSYPIFDLWKIFINIDGGQLPSIIKHSQETLVNGELPNSSFFYRINVNEAGTTLGDNSYYELLHFIENGTRHLCGLNNKVSLSFYARSNIPNKKLGFFLGQSYGTGGSPSIVEHLIGNYVNLTNNWQLVTMTFTTNTLTDKTFGTNRDDVLTINLVLAYGSTFASNVGDTVAESFKGSGNIDIAQVQLNAGEIPLPFELKTFDEELRSCQRYLERNDSLTTLYCNSANTLSGFHFKVQKRIKPSVMYRPQIGQGSLTFNNTISPWGGGQSISISPGEITKDGVSYSSAIVSSGNKYVCTWYADARF